MQACDVTKDVFECLISLPFKYWNYKCVPPHLDYGVLVAKARELHATQALYQVSCIPRPWECYVLKYF